MYVRFHLEVQKFSCAVYIHLLDIIFKGNSSPVVAVLFSLFKQQTKVKRLAQKPVADKKVCG